MLTAADRLPSTSMPQVANFPSYDAFMNPLLHALKALGGSGTIEEINTKVIELVGLSDEQLEIIHDPERGSQTEVEYRLAWARTYLKRYCVVDNSSRGIWALTPKGREIDQVNPQAVKRYMPAEQRKKVQVDDEKDALETVTKQLSQLLELDISQIQSEQGGLPATVRSISVFDTRQNERCFILKRQDNKAAYALYKHYLEPYNLNSPKTYGYVELDGHPFLVMEYVNHSPADWQDSVGYLKAVEWLIKKDLVTSQHLDSVRNLDCLGKMEYYGVQYWLAIFEKWYTDSPDNHHAHAVWRTVLANHHRLDEYIDELGTVGVQTVVHGDLHLSNMLFAEDESQNELFVIDWTQPHIGSVTKDLASLYDNAPATVKNELLTLYRTRIDFPQFDEIFAKAKVLRDVGYLSWMVEMLNEMQSEEIDQNELDRVVTSLCMSLE